MPAYLLHDPDRLLTAQLHALVGGRRYANTTAMAATIKAVRATKTASGGPNRRVGWYTSGAPAGTHALNTFAEFSSLRARLMLGAAAWKMKIDGYLCVWMHVDSFCSNRAVLCLLLCCLALCLCGASCTASWHSSGNSC